MNQKQFAESQGISIHTLKSWIKNERIPEVSMAYSLAIALGVTLNYLLGEKESDLEKARKKELEARVAAAKIIEYAEQILKQAKKLRPLAKK